MTYAIRTARPDEAGAIVEIEDAAADLFAVFGLAQVADLPTGDRSFYAACCAAGTVWLAVPAGRGAPVGFVAAAVRDHALWLAELAVLPAHGRRGLGGRLVRTAIDWAARHGLPAVELTTFRDLPFNAPFYARLGFQAFQPGPDRPHLAGIRRSEVARGLDSLQPRVAMRLRLGTAPQTAPAAP